MVSRSQQTNFPTGVAPLLDSPEDQCSLKFDDLGRANLLQSQFCSVFTREPEGEVPHIEPRSNKDIEGLFISEDMVHKQFEELLPDKSFGSD